MTKITETRLTLFDTDFEDKGIREQVLESLGINPDFTGTIDLYIHDIELKDDDSKRLSIDISEKDYNNKDRISINSRHDTKSMIYDKINKKLYVKVSVMDGDIDNPKLGYRFFQNVAVNHIDSYYLDLNEVYKLINDMHDSIDLLTWNNTDYRLYINNPIFFIKERVIKTLHQFRTEIKDDCLFDKYHLRE